MSLLATTRSRKETYSMDAHVLALTKRRCFAMRRTRKGKRERSMPPKVVAHATDPVTRTPNSSNGPTGNIFRASRGIFYFIRASFSFITHAIGIRSAIFATLVIFTELAVQI
jgi:hypothetical protein